MPAMLQERVLVPFFEPSDMSHTTFEPLERWVLVVRTLLPVLGILAGLGLHA